MLLTKLLLREHLSNICLKSIKFLLVFPEPIHTHTYINPQNTLAKELHLLFPVLSNHCPCSWLRPNPAAVLVVLCSSQSKRRWGFVLLARKALGCDTETSDREYIGAEEYSEGMGWPHTHSHTDVQYVCREVMWSQFSTGSRIIEELSAQDRAKCKEVKVYVCATFKGKNETMTVCVGSVYEKERWISVGSNSWLWPTQAGSKQAADSLATCQCEPSATATCSLPRTQPHHGNSYQARLFYWVNSSHWWTNPDIHS